MFRLTNIWHIREKFLYVLEYFREPLHVVWAIDYSRHGEY